MKRSLVFIAAIVIFAFSISKIQGSPNYSDLNELKFLIGYTPKDGYLITIVSGPSSQIGRTCGPTNSSGNCGIISVPEGTYGITADNGGCISSVNNIYHPGSGITTTNVNSAQDCYR